MRRDILAVGLQQSFLAALTPAMQMEDIHIISSPSLDVAGWLLEHRKMKVALIDLELFSQVSSTFLLEAEKQSLHIIVMGKTGFRYSWPVERESDSFLSYETSIQQLVSHIAGIMSSRCD